PRWSTCRRFWRSWQPTRSSSRRPGRMRTKEEAVAHPFAATASASSNAIARFGFLVFLASESMLFAGLLAALAMFRSRADHWPPLGLPRLPVAVTALNSLLLFASALPMGWALRSVRRDDTA